MANPINELMESSLDKIKTMADSNTVIGQPILTADGTTLIPISRVKISYAGGGSEFSGKHASDKLPYGGGAGAIADVIPIAFLISKESSTRILPIPTPPGNSVDRLLEMLPDFIEKIASLLPENQKKTGEETT